MSPDNEHRNRDVRGVVRGIGFFRLYRHLDRDFGREQAEQSRELDDGVHGYGGGILEGVAYRVADDRCGVERRALFLQVDFDNLLRVVPRAAGVGHVDGLEEAEAGDGNQVGDEEVGVRAARRRA